MAKRIAHLRRRAARAQQFRCYYCALPIWEQDPQAFCNRFDLGLRQATLLRCTAEHVVALCDGGRDVSQNIVAACHYCNSSRHAVPRPKRSDAYREHVRLRMQKGRWLAGLLRAPSLFEAVSKQALSQGCGAG